MKNQIKTTRFHRLGCIAALSGTMAMGASPARAALFSLSEQDEIRAGQQAAAQAQKEYGRALSPNDPMSRRVRAIGMKFAALSQRRNIPYSYTVLQNDKVLNAFAAPGGPIFVTTRLVKTTSNDAELAYVLGHETGHVDRRHIAKAVEKQQKVGLAAGILGAILGRGKNGAVLGTAVNATYTLWSRGYSRNDENDADAVGTRFMSRLGYDPRAALSMLAKLGEAGGGSSGVLDKYLSTHPDPKARIAKVSAEIRNENLLNVAQQNGGPRLSDRGNYGNTGDDYYAGNTNYPNASNTNYPNPNNSGDQYPDYANAGTAADNRNVGYGNEVDLGAPLRIVERADSSVILAPVAGIARWANARMQTRGKAVTLTRAGQTLEVRRDSTVAFDNGQRRDLAIAPAIFNGQLYAPLGDLVEGLGGRARFDNATNSVRMSIDNRPEDSITLR